MKKQFLTTFALFFCCLFAAAQTPEQYIKAAKQATELRNYAAAAEYYKILLEDEHYQNDYTILYNCGESYRLSNAPKQAIIYYNRIKKTDEFPDFNRNIALIHKQLGDCAKAKTYFDKIKNPTPEVQLEAEGCQLAGKKDPQTVWKIESIKQKTLNSESADYATAERNGTLVFTSNRAEVTLGNGDLAHLSGIYSFERNKTEEVLMPKNGKTYQYAFLYQTTMYLAICNDVGKKCKIADSDVSKGLNKLDFQPLKADFEWGNATMPFVTAENGTMILYFAADRAGGKGGSDIWKARFDSGKKIWTAPENLDFNTPNDEIAPTFDTTANTLYYSSNGKASLGGYDVFAFKNQENTHLPEPVNSSYDDYFFFKTTDTTAYISSTRNPQLKKGENGLCCSDIYKLKASFKKQTPPVVIDTPPIAGTKPVLPNTPNKPEIPPVTPPEKPVKPETPPIANTPPITPPATKITPPTIADTPPTIANTPPKVTNTPPKVTNTPPIFDDVIALYFHNDEPDPDTYLTMTTRNYAQTYKRYSIMRSVYVKGYTAGLSGDRKAEAAQRVNDFFDQKLEANYARLEEFTTNLQTALANGQRVTIELRGYCSPRASSDYNTRLSKRRVSCLKNYFYRYQNGVLSTYLKGEKLQIKELPLGETTAPSDISDKYKDLRGSVYSPEASLERRVEIVKVSVE